jgi:hypothetical protein
MEETYDGLKKELAQLYEDIQKPIKCSDGKWRNLVVGESNDMKMGLLLTGRDKLYLKSSKHLCIRCTTERAFLPNKHHFDGALTTQDWEDFKSLDQEGDEENIAETKNHDQSASWMTLEELANHCQKIKRQEEIIQGGDLTPRETHKAREELAAFKREVGVVGETISTVPLFQHFTELIHLTEGAVKRAVKLMVLEAPPGSLMEKRVVHVFKKYANITFRDSNGNEQLWQRLDKTRLNRVQWLHMLQGFFDESG